MDDKIILEMKMEAGVGVIRFLSPSMSDTEAIRAASEQIEGFVEEKRPDKLVVDFGEVKFFSSQILGVLLNTRSKMLMYDGELVISSINPQMYRVFKITNLHRIFRFFPDRETAVAEMSVD